MRNVSFETFGLNGRLLGPPRPMGYVHHHQEIEINYVFRGQVEYLVNGRLLELPLRRLTAFWGAMPHRLVSNDPAAEMVWLTVPLSDVLKWDLPKNLTARLLRGDWCVGPSESQSLGDRFAVRSWAAEFKSADPMRARGLILELQACMLWLAERGEPARYAPSARRNAMPDSAQLLHVGQMLRYMAGQFALELSVEDVGNAAGLHPNYAMYLFRRYTGVTIHLYLTRLRIAQAERLLVTSDRKIVDIAAASGFRSLSAFYDSFLDVAGTTPKQYRLQMRGEVGADGV